MIFLPCQRKFSPPQRELDEDTDMAISSYASRPPVGHSQQLPSFRELLPAHLHDEIDSSAYHHSRQSQERPGSSHEMADPRSMPAYSPSSKAPYDRHHEYTTREAPRMAEHMSMRLESSARGPSPMLPPIRDLGMNERKGYDRVAPRADHYHEYRSQPAMPVPMVDRREQYPNHMMQPYHPPYHEEQMSPPMMGHPQQANFGIMGDPSDSKSKRRRGNLPKPVTDILRAWFHEHLDHPYPSEEDKQMFMTRTGLSISQISNWFINARRRQLPALRNQMRSGADDRHSPFSDVDQGSDLASPHH